MKRSHTSAQDSTVGEYLKSFIILLIRFCLIHPFAWETCLFVDWVFYSPKMICVRQIVSNQTFVNDKLPLYGKPSKSWNTDIRPSPYGPYNSFYAHAYANEYRGMTVQRISQNQPKRFLFHVNLTISCLRAFSQHCPALKHHHYRMFTCNPAVLTRREFFLVYWLHILTVSTFLYKRTSYNDLHLLGISPSGRNPCGGNYGYMSGVCIHTYFIKVTNT